MYCESIQPDGKDRISPNIRMIYYLALYEDLKPYWVHNDTAAINYLGEFADKNGIGMSPKDYMRALVKELLQKG